MIRSSFRSKSSRHGQSQAVRAKKLKFLRNVHPSPCVTCHMSHVMCHMSRVKCRIFGGKGGQNCWASRWRVIFQRCLSHQVYLSFNWDSTNILMGDHFCINFQLQTKNIDRNRMTVSQNITNMINLKKKWI